MSEVTLQGSGTRVKGRKSGLRSDKWEQGEREGEGDGRRVCRCLSRSESINAFFAVLST